MSQDLAPEKQTNCQNQSVEPVFTTKEFVRSNSFTISDSIQKLDSESQSKINELEDAIRVLRSILTSVLDINAQHLERLHLEEDQELKISKRFQDQIDLLKQSLEEWKKRYESKDVELTGRSAMYMESLNEVEVLKNEIKDLRKQLREDFIRPDQQIFKTFSDKFKAERSQLSADLGLARKTIERIQRDNESIRKRLDEYDRLTVERSKVVDDQRNDVEQIEALMAKLNSLKRKIMMKAYPTTLNFSSPTAYQDVETNTGESSSQLLLPQNQNLIESQDQTIETSSGTQLLLPKNRSSQEEELSNPSSSSNPDSNLSLPSDQSASQARILGNKSSSTLITQSLSDQSSSSSSSSIDLPHQKKRSQPKHYSTSDQALTDSSKRSKLKHQSNHVTYSDQTQDILPMTQFDDNQFNLSDKE
ncbi:hypothetical protein BY996DRAFT_7757005 [Phakopsora pachyrhizi]|uniref:Expressed protein n=1 Tax=Phakopsora pachyrhizi TaxID=170000 RepID=A0AAV0BH54_PHAPC|nr:hypothetical protein BY996DRAFT_7757005 [Phakopsora pachyrhizi]CAH7685417.1 expressed protein [Phakopsora pachyrhizi]